jgi:hypothetical protein
MKMYRSLAAISLVLVTAACAGGQPGYNNPETLAARIVAVNSPGSLRNWVCITSGEQRITCSGIVIGVGSYTNTYLVSEDGKTVIPNDTRVISWR